MLGNTPKKIKINQNLYELWQTVARVVEAQRYKLECRGFDSRGLIGIFHWNNLSRRTKA